MHTVLIIPALNEEECIGATLDRVPRDLFREIIVADNGSSDQTARIAALHGATVVAAPRRGYGAACLRAIEMTPFAEVYVFLQADSSEDPAEASMLLAPILDGRADLVLGSRTLGAADPGSLLPVQRFGNWLATGLIRLLFGHRYTDLCGFRAIWADSLKRLNMRDRTYGWTIEMQVKALRYRLRVMEVPVTYRKRLAGQNKISGNLKATFSAGAKIVWTVLKLRLQD